VIEGSEVDEIVGGVGPDDELIGRLQSHGGPEVTEREGDRTAEVHIARIPEESHPRMGPVLDRTRRSGIRRSSFCIHSKSRLFCDVSVQLVLPHERMYTCTSFLLTCHVIVRLLLSFRLDEI
jgi:hypothetical protein